MEEVVFLFQVKGPQLRSELLKDSHHLVFFSSSTVDIHPTSFLKVRILLQLIKRFFDINICLA